MKKIFRLIIMLTLVVLVATVVYLWIVEPIICTICKVDDEQTNLIMEELSDTENTYNGNFKDGFPSDDFHDYRDVNMSLKVDYRSVFKLLGASARILSVESKYADRIVQLREGVFPDDETIPENFTKRSMDGLGMVIYTGDCKDEEQIKEIIKDLVEGCTVEMTYSMQWIGMRHLELQYNLEEVKIEYLEFAE